MVLGIVISVATLTIALAIFEGYENALKETILNVNSHIYIYNGKDKNLDNSHYLELGEFFSEKKEIKKIGKIIINQAMVTKSKKVKGAIVRGVEWQKELPNSYKKFVYEGDYKLADENSAVLGYRLAKELNIKIGDKFKLISPIGSKMTSFGFKQKECDFEVVGLYKSGMYEYDSKYLFIDFQKAAEFYDMQNQFTMLEMELKNEFIEQADLLSYLWDNELEQKYQIHSWIDFNGNLFSLLAMEKWVIYIILSFLILIASFNVVSAISTSIIKRKKEIGILKTFGASNEMLIKIFLIRIFLISFIAVSLGQLSGFLLAKFISWQNFFMLKGEVYFLDAIHVDFSIISWIIILFTALILIMLSIIIPLKNINKLRIIDIIK